MWDRFTVTSTKVALPRWAEIGHQVFWPSWTVAIVLNAIEAMRDIEVEGVYFAFRVALSIVWVVAGLAWAAGAFLRRRRARV